MKRLFSDHVYGSRVDNDIKRIKNRSHCHTHNALLDLPHDIISQILSLVDTPSIINLCSTNTEFRNELSPIVFSRAKGSWHQLIQMIEQSEGTMSDFKPDSNMITPPPQILTNWVEQLRISDWYSYGEWQVDIFKLHQILPHLNHLLINSANSSNWLKYRESKSLKELTLYYEKAHYEAFDHKPNPKNINQLSRKESTNPRIFELSHLRGLSELTKVSLDGYHFNWCDDYETYDPSNIKLDSIVLTNCTWEYPFTLSQFNRHGKLRNLTLRYTTQNSFILSERFTKFMENPLVDASTSIEKLEISLEGYTDSTWRKLLSIKQFDKFQYLLFPNLRVLTLHGFSMNLDSYRSYLTLIQDNFRLHRLNLAVWDTSTNGLSDINSIRFSQHIRQLGINFQLKVLDENRRLYT
ncbi:hypothetical protein CAAN3_19S02278 [[Candida] anglica]